MKLATDTLLEIVAIIQDGFANGKDVSQALRDLDLEQVCEPDGEVAVDAPLTLSKKYLAAHPRGHQAEN